ncbi:MAG: FAD-dependent oxidoreductase [Clostridia bacterium]|nr:FAD-dependent oxidoreductase [Clostridia bacterium]
MENKHYDKIIIGAGLYGLYAANRCARKGDNILVIECEAAPFTRATYINQARVHQGYHYPRSLATALKSAGYFKRFNEDYDFCINSKFKQIYATSAQYSWTDRKQFKSFCKAANIRCEEINPAEYIKNDMCDGLFITEEYTYDAHILRDYFIRELNNLSNVTVMYNVKITEINHDSSYFYIVTADGISYCSEFVLNATYAGVNQILDKAGLDKFKIKYELCEIILCNTSDNLKEFGLTVMDGPFFSIMPFGKTGLHSLTSVTFTPHHTSYSELPVFSCQAASENSCSAQHLANCNLCQAKPKSAFPYMSNLASKYLLDKYEFYYKESLFSMKPILLASEIDDSRPTVIKISTSKPVFVSVLSGKINTIYDLDEVLDGNY